jgi:formylglycine-generating enzyme required for sulfatase activity
MHGHVWEWCADAFDQEAYQGREDGVTDPKIEPSKESANRFVRGGSWFRQALDCRSASRDGAHPGDRNRDLGLRLAAGQEPVAAEPPGAERPSGPAA